ncbi:hypothetical protein IJF85_02090 [Candidatus Saccharibacteria bacterium]|nr:hypothetical protein [Candidatus Saccharibacteria bacterium]
MEFKNENYQKALAAVAMKSPIDMIDGLAYWFAKHPLTDEQASDILCLLNKLLEQDSYEIFAKAYGIGGETKQSLRKIANAMSYPLEITSRILNDVISELAKPKNFCQLCYVVFGEREYGRQMVMTEIKLRTMQAIFRSRSDHDISGHSIAVELPVATCEKLADAGVLTMEDISETGVHINLIQKLTHVDRDIISDALDRLGLDNRVQEGIVLGHDDETLKFAVKETHDSVKIFFHPGDFCPDREAILEEIKSLASRGLCTGGVYESLRNGEVKLWFNPLVQSCDMRRTAISEMKKAIMQPNSAATLTAGADADVLTAGE